MVRQKLTAKQMQVLAGGGVRPQKKAREVIDTSQRNWEISKENKDLLYKCANDWDTMRPMREEHRRIMRYVEGDQWGDLVPDPDNIGKFIREDILISRSGRNPMTNNILQQYIRSIYGQRLSNPSQPVVNALSEDDMELSEMLTNTIRANLEMNDIDTIELSVLTGLCFGGIGVTKERFEYWSEKDKSDGRVEFVNSNRIFFNQDTESPLMDDIVRIGEIHDYSMNDILRNFAKDKADEARLKELYTSWHSDLALLRNSRDNLRSLDFYGALNLDKCRVIEVWEKKGRWCIYAHDYADGTETVYTDTPQSYFDTINEERLSLAESIGIESESVPLIYTEPRYEDYWNVKFLTPTAVCLQETETPYKHQGHPYTIASTPRIDGKSKPVFSDLLGMQRQINRLVTMLDFMLAASAKGVLILTEDMLGNMSLEQIKGEYVKTNGVIVLSAAAAGKMPQELVSRGASAGAWEMLSFYTQQISQISGLSGAIQGQVAGSNTPASLYAQQAQNSMLNFVVVFDRLNKWYQKMAEKLLKVLMQYYTTPRYININGRAYNKLAEYYKPQMVQKLIDFNLTVSNSVDTPLFRQMSDKMLFDLLNAGQINIELFLDNVSSMPFSKKLLNNIKALKEQQETVQQETGGAADYRGASAQRGALLNEIGQEATANANPHAVALLNQAMAA